MARQPKSGFSIFGGDQCETRTKMVHPITLKKKKSKKKAYRTPLLTNMDKGAKRGVTACPVVHELAEKQPQLVAHLSTHCKVSKAENSVGGFEVDEEDEIKLTVCGQVEAEVREGKGV